MAKIAQNYTFFFKKTTICHKICDISCILSHPVYILRQDAYSVFHGKTAARISWQNENLFSHAIVAKGKEVGYA